MRRFITFLFLLLIPVVAFASGAEGGHEVNPKMELMRIINFIVFFALLYKFAGKAVINYFKTRSQGIEKAIKEAEAARAEAEKSYSEAKSKIENLEIEVREILANAEKEKEEQIKRIQEETEAMISRIKEQARLASELEVKRAKMELQKEAVDLAVNLAEDLLKKKLSPEDHKKLVEDYITKVKEVH